jgi:hypothetical protein
MPVDTKTVQGRRELKFGSLDEVVTDAEQLVASPNTKVLGNWPLSQLLSHLTTAINGSIDGIPVKAPLFLRLVARLMKGRILRNKMSPGLRLPKAAEAGFYPTVASPQVALEGLRAAVSRSHTEQMIAGLQFIGSHSLAELGDEDLPSRTRSPQCKPQGCGSLALPIARIDVDVTFGRHGLMRILLAWAASDPRIQFTGNETVRCGYASAPTFAAPVPRRNHQTRTGRSSDSRA